MFIIDLIYVINNAIRFFHCRFLKNLNGVSFELFAPVTRKSPVFFLRNL